MKRISKYISAAALVGAGVALQAASADEPAGNMQAAAAPSLAAVPAAGEATALYQVVDGDRVDTDTLKGWKAWRSMACDRCHGPNQEGLVGPSLVQSLKVLTRDEFKTVVLNGRIEKGMPNFGGTPTVVDNIDGLYGYLKGRSDGAIKPGKLRGIE
jgi:mono/diheme cytochrome c family protein